ncbi:MAG: OmpA family protein [Bacteroidetes bacterium]|nr:OmpA family protein [Bacteroidota bacterium]
MRKFYLAFVLSLIFKLLIYPQDKTTQLNTNTLSTWSLSIESGMTLSQTDYSGTGTDILGRFSVEYKFPSSTKSSFGFKFWGGGGFIAGSDDSKLIKNFRTGFKTIGAGVVYGLSLSSKTSVYVMAGPSYFSFNPKGVNGVKLPNNAAGNYSTSEINYVGEFGLRFGITDNLKFIINTGVNFSNSDNLDDITSGLKNDMFITTMAGFSYTLSSKRDEDKDGVEDSDDMCPNTPEDVKVNEFGCPVDTDGDGVADYLDECSNIPKNVLVDQKVCPVDSDKDGVPDYSDLCPDTPLGISVDDFGCPFDIDADGIPDYKDKCPDTPTGIAVDDKGCLIDFDLDGIPDYKDNCPDTQHGMMVDSTGCVKIKTQKKKIEKKKEIIKQKKKKIETKIKPKIKTVKKITPKLPKKIKIDYDIFTLSGDNYFRFGKSTLLQTAFPYLNGLVEYMKKNLLSRWWIEGYTDNVGSKGTNQKLSLERAKAVLDYFVKKGIIKQRFKVIGLGESFPIASNKTKKGRAKNRRVVIVRTY